MNVFGSRFVNLLWFDMNLITEKIEKIRTKYQLRMDADESGDEVVDKKSSGLATRLPYALCKKEGINTEGMTPYEAWVAYKEKTGIGHDEKLGSVLKEKKKKEPATEKKPEPKAEKKSGVMSLSNFGEVKDYFAKEYGLNIDENLKKADFETVQRGVAGIEKAFSEFPFLKNSVKGISEFKHKSAPFAFGFDDHFYFNPDYKSAKLKQKCSDLSESGIWIKNCTPESILVHEAGHAVEKWIIDKIYEGSYYEKVKAWNGCTVAKGIISAACKNVKKTPYGKGKVNADLISSISKYAAKNNSETLAEAIHDCYANGDNANPLSKEIKKLTLEKVKSLGG